VRTLVISDLHLGARTDVDVLRRPAAQQALLGALDGVDRLVILGDLLELRHGPMHEALEAARPVLRAVGEALGSEGEVVLVPGNHDFRLISPWLEWRSRNGPEPLGLQERAGPKASTGTRAIARMLQPASLDVVYPGIWLDDGIYASHGHYVDRHITIPSFERLGAGVLGRLLGAPADRAAAADDYEMALAPMYALLDAIAARVGDGRAAAPGNASMRAWERLSRDGDGDPRAWRGRALAAAFPLAIAGLNRLGVGPLKADLSGAELRRANLRAMGEVVSRLGIEARHVIFGHTHRSGPLPDDERNEWRLAGGAQLLNTGCWVYESMYLDRDWGNPYWPGAAAELDSSGEPRFVRLLEGVDAGALRPPAAPLPA
jgi:Calcineurin-like phosphoesterase